MLIELTPVKIFQSTNDTVKRTGFPLVGGNDKGGQFLFLVIPAKAGIQYFLSVDNCIGNINNHP